MDIRSMEGVTILAQVSNRTEKDIYVPPDPCGDFWCINGGQNYNPNTYFLCETCSKCAPDAVRMGLVRVPKNSSAAKIQAFNANYLSTLTRMKRIGSYESFSLHGSGPRGTNMLATTMIKKTRVTIILASSVQNVCHPSPWTSNCIFVLWL